MANNYRHFSFALGLKDKKEAKWVEKELTRLETIEDTSGMVGNDFEWSVYGLKPNDGGEIEGCHVWFRDNGESGDVDQISQFVESYLKKFDPNGFFVMTWADTCSKPRVGEFGGGCCVVTAKDTFWFNESEFVKKHAKKLTRRNVG